MAVLVMGSRGQNVLAAQQRLAALGYDPKGQDGIFGSGTEAAVRAFQQAQGLAGDGAIGPATAAALGLVDRAAAEVCPLPPFTIANVMPLFPGAAPGNVSANLPLVLAALLDQGVQDRCLVLGTLATIRAETAGFAPLNEFVSKYNTSPGGAPFDLYNNRAALGNGPDDGARFKGRGFVQLTGRDNYTRIGQALGVDLVNDPDLANEPETAARILAYFIWRVRDPMLSALQAGDMASARRLVNGGTFGLSAFSDTYSQGTPLLTMT